MGQVVVALAIGMVPLGAMVLVKRVYFVLEDARGIFFIHIPMAIAWVAVAYLGMVTLDRKWWTVCVALGLTVSNVVGLALRSGGLRRGSAGSTAAASRACTCSRPGAAIVAGLIGWALRYFVMPSVAEMTGSAMNNVVVGGFVCLVVGTVMALVYGVVLKVAEVSEVDALLARVTGRLRRNVR